MRKIPEAEFEIMKVVWANKPEWKAPTVITLMLRLVERGFLKTEKNGKECTYFPLVTKDDYLKFETGNFIRQYHGNSFVSFVNTLYDGEQLSEEDMDELMKLVKERRT